MDASYRLFKKKKEQSTIKTIRNKAEGPRVVPKPIVGEASLPHEIVVKIFEYLGAINVLKISRTCRFWHETSNDLGLWRDFCRLAIFKSLINNYEDGTNDPKDTICHRFCEKQMKLLSQVKETAGSATSLNFWKEKYFTMLMDDMRSLYSCKGFTRRETPATESENDMIKITTYKPDGTTTEEDFIPETIYKVLALVNDDTNPDYSGIFQTVDGYYLLNYWGKQFTKHWSLETLLTRFTTPYLREMWHLPLLSEFGKFWSDGEILSRALPTELRWYLIKAGLKLIKSCDKCYDNSKRRRKTILGGGSAVAFDDEGSQAICDVCSGRGDAWIFEAIDPLPSDSNKKIDREVYSAQQILLRISTQWRKHKEQMIDRHLNAVMDKYRSIKEGLNNNNNYDAQNDRKRKFDELVDGSDLLFDYEHNTAKKFKLIESTEELETLQIGSGWNTWLSKKGYAGIENFARRLNEQRPLPYLADVLYPTEIKLENYGLSLWQYFGPTYADFELVENNEFFAAHQLEYDKLVEFVDKHKILPRASVYSYRVINLARWRRVVLFNGSRLHRRIWTAEEDEPSNNNV